MHHCRSSWCSSTNPTLNMYQTSSCHSYLSDSYPPPPRSSEVRLTLKALLQILSAQSLMDSPGVNDGHVKDLPVPHLGPASCWVLAHHLIRNVDTFHADVISYHQWLIPIHCSSVDCRQHGDNAAVLQLQDQQPHLATVVVYITLPPHTGPELTQSL